MVVIQSGFEVKVSGRDDNDLYWFYLSSCIWRQQLTLFLFSSLFSPDNSSYCIIVVNKKRETSDPYPTPSPPDHSVKYREIERERVGRFCGSTAEKRGHWSLRLACRRWLTHSCQECLKYLNASTIYKLRGPVLGDPTKKDCRYNNNDGNNDINNHHYNHGYLLQIAILEICTNSVHCTSLYR